MLFRSVSQSRYGATLFTTHGGTSAHLYYQSVQKGHNFNFAALKIKRPPKSDFLAKVRPGTPSNLITVSPLSQHETLHTLSYAQKKTPPKQGPAFHTRAIFTQPRVPWLFLYVSFLSYPSSQVRQVILPLGCHQTYLPAPPETPCGTQQRPYPTRSTRL